MKTRILFLLLCLSLLLALPVAAAEEEDRVWDTALLLTEQEEARLEERAAQIAQSYGCEVYIVTVDSCDSASIDSYAHALYYDNALGYGPDQDGVMLLLSMLGRDYNLRSEGSFGQTAFSDYTLDRLEDSFLDDFKYDDWMGGFEDYLDGCEKYLAMAAEGEPFSAETDPGQSFKKVLAVILIPCVVALIVCLILKGQLKTVKKASTASEYAIGRVELREKTDRFTHTTRVRRRIQSSSGSSGSHSRSGKF